MTPYEEFLMQEGEMRAALNRAGQRAQNGGELEIDRENIKTLAVEIVAALGSLVEAFGGDRRDFMHDMSGTGDAVDEAFADAITARDTEREVREYERSEARGRRRYGFASAYQAAE